jgi:8-oxo-dGTP diphosphatase
VSETKEKSVRIRIGGLLFENDRVLLANHVKNGRSYYLLPGGGLEFGEKIEDTLRREFREECGFEVEPDEFLFSSETIYPDGERHILHLVFRVRRARNRFGIEDETSGKSVDPRVFKTEFVPLAELSRLLVVPPVEDEIREAARAIGGGQEYRPRHLGVRWREIV